MKTYGHILFVAILFGAASSGSAQTQMGTAFTYQAELKQDGSPVNDTCDFEFRLWSDPTDTDPMTSQVGATQVENGVVLTDGLLTAVLDFGEPACNGNARWVEIAVSCPAGGSMTILSPRQELTPAPYALALPGMRTEQRTDAPNLIGGRSDNWVASDVLGATISGGGFADETNDLLNRVTDSFGTVGGGADNQAGNDDGDTNDTLATVGGGYGNRATASFATVAGGSTNAAEGDRAAVGGGFNNTASGTAATVPGGDNNIASGYASFAAGNGAQALHYGSFVWNSAGTDFPSTADAQFLIQAGRVGIGTNEPDQKLHVAGSVKVDDTLYASTVSSNIALQLQTAGTTRIYIDDATGFVGVGTDQPNAQLHVDGGILVDTVSSPSGQVEVAGSLIITDTSGDIAAKLTKETKWLAIKGAGWPDSGAVFVGNNDTSNSVILRTRTNDAQSAVDIQKPDLGSIAYFRGDGKVGIGTDNPASELSVIGVVRSAADAAETEHTEIGHGGSNGYINTVGDGRLDFRHDSVTLMSLTDSGRVGIGETDPQADLHIAGSQTQAFRLDRPTAQNSDRLLSVNTDDITGGFLMNPAGVVVLEAREANDTDTKRNSPALLLRGRYHNGLPGEDGQQFTQDFWLGTKIDDADAGAARLTFGLSADPLMSIDEDGKVGIGTTDPQHRLHLRQDGTPGNMLKLEQDAVGVGAIITFQHNSAAHGFNIGQAHKSPGGGPSNHQFQISNASDPWTRYFTIDLDGNVGINEITPTAKLHVNGDAKFTQGNRSVQIRPGNTDGSGEITIANASGSDSIIIDGQTGAAGGLIDMRDGGKIQMFNGAGDSRIELDGQNGTGLFPGNVEVASLTITGGADLAEPFDVADDGVRPGMVLSIDPDRPGQLRISRHAYDPTVAGVVSGAGGVDTGLMMSQRGKLDGSQPVALTGRVYCWCDAANGAITPGDLLTTSEAPGHAMKVTDRNRSAGAIIGKAMSRLESGRGLVLVLVALQ